ncbi:MAG: thioredoxin domain-containing protein [Cenarchaeum sp. SB0672_bin_9]|nr:thioredoxin domain-containing protein [Cenarchaeum sp. SB0672_bin_9]
MSHIFLLVAMALMVSVAGHAYAQSEDRFVRLETTQGEIVIELFSQDAPNHVNNFVKLVDSGFYDGTVFHRVIDNFILQGGDPNTINGEPATWGTGGSAETLDQEFNDIRHHRGIVSMARAGYPDSASSQFFIVLRDADFLNGLYTVFGRVSTEESFQTLADMASIPTDTNGMPQDPAQARIIEALVVGRSEVSGLLDLPAPERTDSVTSHLTERQIIESVPYDVDLDASALRYPGLGVEVEVVAENLIVPWSIDWTPDGTILFTERGGSLRYIQNGELVLEPLLSLSADTIEGGLLGVAVDPNFQENNHIYLYYTYNEPDSGITANKVVRYVFTNGEVAEDLVLIEGIPGGDFHDGGRIQFGPDGNLYIATGDGGYPDLAQNSDSLAGKILRINPDGTIPHDNPFEGSPVWSLGHRNPQGLDWDESGNLIITEHGPSGWKGVGHDELNLITPGTNYGWPVIVGDQKAEGMQTAIFNTGTVTWAPSGAEFYDGDSIPQWTGKYFVATLRGSHLHMINFDLQEGTVVSHSRLFQDDFGRLRDVQTGPDDFLYILTSNRDGRGSADHNDDRILRVVPLLGSDISRDILEGNAVSYESTIVVDGTEYFIGYEITGGDLLRIMSNTDSKSLVVSIDADSHGSLTLDIPRIVADAKLAGEYNDYRVPEGILQFGRASTGLNDRDYIVLVNGEVADFGETASAATRTLTIEFSPETKVIEIVGTFVQAPISNYDVGSLDAGPLIIGGVNLSQASPRLGSADAPVTIIEFGDYQCPRCKSWFENTKPQIDSDYINAGSVNLYFVDVDYIGGDSHTASVATYCAQEQDMYWEYHGALYENQRGIHSGWASASSLVGFANDMGLDTAEFEACLQSSEQRDRLDFNVEQGINQGVRGTPHFIIVGPEGSIHIRGPQPYGSFDSVIQDLLN